MTICNLFHLLWIGAKRRVRVPRLGIPGACSSHDRFQVKRESCDLGNKGTQTNLFLAACRAGFQVCFEFLRPVVCQHSLDILIQELFTNDELARHLPTIFLSFSRPRPRLHFTALTVVPSSVAISSRS